VRPSVVVLGFVMGSSAAITFALLGVAIVFGLLNKDHPQLAMELPQLLVNLAMFGVLTAVAAASFYGQLRRRAWRLGAVLALVAGLIVIAWLQWPVA
jgi:hypothetical protein